MNRNDIKEFFINLKTGQQGQLLKESGTPNYKQTGEHTPEEYLLSAIVVAAWEAGARWASGGHTMQADRAAGELEDGIGDAGLLIPPVTPKTRTDLEMLYKALESNKGSGFYDDSFSADLDYGGLEAEEDALEQMRNPDYYDDEEDEDTEDDFSPEYRQMVGSGRSYDK